MKNQGFSMIEIIIVIGLISIVSVMAAPNLISWRDEANLRGAVNNLRGDLQLAKALAARENSRVAVTFFTDRYEIFVDNGTGVDGIAGNNERDGSETLVKTRKLAPGVNIDIDHPDYTFSTSNHATNFGPRGIATSGTLVVLNRNGTQKQITVTFLGKINVG